MSSLTYTLGDLMAELENRLFVVPEIQGPFVWSESKIRDLAESIYHRDAIGAIIIWDMPKAFVEDYQDLLRPLAEDLEIKNAKYMIIDGQQRLTSLLLMKRGKLKFPGRRSAKRLHLYFHPFKEEFTLDRRRVKSEQNWIPLTEIINAEDTYSLLESYGLLDKRPARDSINKLKNAFTTYPIVMVKIDLSYSPDQGFLDIFERISRMFVRLNTRGVRVKMPHIVEALLTATTRRQIGDSFKSEFTSILEDLEAKGFDVPETVAMRIYMVISTEKIRFKECENELKQMKGEEIMNKLKIMNESLNEVIRMLKDFGINDIRYLHSKYLVVPITYHVWKRALQPGKMLPTSDRRSILQWLILASFNERYTGKLETDLREDIELLKEGHGFQTLTKKLPIKELNLDSLEGEYETKHLTLLRILYRYNEALDWDLRTIKEGRTPRKIYELSYDDIHIHHIFPDSILRRESRYEDLINEFANITIISKEANKQIWSHYPHNYLAKLKELDPELLERHFIPDEPELWKLENYKEFLEKRKSLILQSAKELLE